MKKWQIIILSLIIVLSGLLVFKDQVIKATVNTVGSNVIGAPLKVGKLSLGIISQKISLKDIKLYNPKGFPDEPLIDVPEIRVDYDLGALLKGELRLSLVVIDLKELVVLKNKEGNLNVDSLKVSQPAEEVKKDAGDSDKKKAESMPMLIEELRLNLGQVVYKDYTKGDQPVIEAFDIGFKDKVFKNINSPQKLVSIVLLESMKSTSIKGAKIYAVASFLGPAGLAASVLISDDDVRAEFDRPFAEIFQAGLAVVSEMGELKSKEESKGIIKAHINGHDVAVHIEQKTAGVHQVTISARKLMLPKPKAAGGVMHQLKQKLGG